MDHVEPKGALARVKSYIQAATIVGAEHQGVRS